MNDINNLIYEELGKMTQLFHYQRGKVISEQTTDVGTDVGQMMRQLDATNTDENAVLNIIKKYKKNQDFQNFVNQYKKISNKDFGTHLFTAINPSNDKREWNDLKTYLATLGITLDYATTNKGKSAMATFKGIGSSPSAVNTNPSEARTKNIGYVYCKVKDGIINIPGSKLDKMKWDVYSKTYKVTPEELVQVQKMCPEKPIDGGELKTVEVTNKVIKNKNRQQVALVNQEIQKSIGSTPTGSLSDADLQQLITKLGGAA